MCGSLIPRYGSAFSLSTAVLASHKSCTVLRLTDTIPRDAKADTFGRVSRWTQLTEPHTARNCLFSPHRLSPISCLIDVPLESQSEKVAREQTWLGGCGNRKTDPDLQSDPRNHLHSCKNFPTCRIWSSKVSPYFLRGLRSHEWQDHPPR